MSGLPVYISQPRWSIRSDATGMVWATLVTDFVSRSRCEELIEWAMQEHNIGQPVVLVDGDLPPLKSGDTIGTLRHVHLHRPFMTEADPVLTLEIKP